MKKEHFYITTPIYYVTAKPHLGSLYSTLIADVIARWQKLQGKKTFFLTGTDEHGQKIAQAAQKANQDPQSFVDSFIPDYQDVWKLYEIEYNYFIRTSSSLHKKGVLVAVKKLIDNGSIYKSVYEGWYCVSCESFITDKNKTKHEDQAPLCPNCFRETTYVAEQTYFFKLSMFQEKLLEFYKEHPDFIIPKERTAEVLSFVCSGLNDLSISRTTVTWGIPFPDDADHVIYVWVDALFNYLTGIGYGLDNPEIRYQDWWPANVQVLGKDIIRFHAVYWPALLMALGLPLPKQLLVHGWIKINNQKMSKSFGNVIDPVDLFRTYGAEPVRYYLLRQLAINQDAEFNLQDLEQRIDSDLANDLGNLLQRATTLAGKYGYGIINPPLIWSPASLELRDNAFTMIQQVQEAMEEYSFHKALSYIWEFIHKINSYFHAHEPWKIASNKKLFEEILSATGHSLHIVAILLTPVLPIKMKELLGAIGAAQFSDEIESPLEHITVDAWQRIFNFRISPLLFQKIINVKELQKNPAMAINNTQSLSATKQSEISIEQFGAVELLVGTIEKVDTLEKSDKLFVLQVDFGAIGKRQILSGIRQYANKEDIVGKQAVFVTNLAPRKMMGLESQGMLLTAKNSQGKLELIRPTNSVENGTQLK